MLVRLAAPHASPRCRPPGGAEAHIWVRWLDCDARDVPELMRELAPDELRRAERFCFARDASRFIVARATLRRILASYLAVAPASIEFDYSPHGKPALAYPRVPIAFNVSHSGGLALYAMTWARRVGIDVEQFRPLDDMDGLAARVFAAPERAELASFPASRRVEAFFNGWARKEAFIKAVGEGLSYPLQRFVVSLDPASPPRLWTDVQSPEQPSGWSLQAIHAAPGYAAACVLEGDVDRLVYRRWTS